MSLVLFPRLRLANLPAHWLFVPPLAFAALNNIALKSETAAPLWKSATEEVSSVVVIFALVPLLIGLARRWPPTFKPEVLAWHLGGSVLFSVAHVLAMVTIRHLVFIAAGDAYRPAPLPEMLVCEYGKDLAVYALIIATIGWFDRRFPPMGRGENPFTTEVAEDTEARGGFALADVKALPRAAQRCGGGLGGGFCVFPRRGAAASRAERAIVSFEVKTARGTVMVPAEQILRVEAAGNYATLVTPQGAFLHRVTMREIESALPVERFARAHRSHIVRLDAIAAIRGPDGEREITLCNGDAVPLSRRFAQARDWHVAVHLGSAKAST